MPRTKEDVGAFLLFYSEWLRPFLKEHRPNIVAFEAPLYLMHGTKTSIHTALKLFGLSTTTELMVTRMREREGDDIACYQVHQQEWKKHFCGFAKFNKKRDPYPPIEASQERGWWPQTHDEADAIGVWDYTCHIVAPEASIETTGRLLGAG